MKVAYVEVPRDIQIILTKSEALSLLEDLRRINNSFSVSTVTANLIQALGTHT